MKDFKEFVEIEEGLKPEHKMRPGWMIKADPVLKAKIAANKAKQKEMKALLGQKLKEEVDSILESYEKAEEHKNKASKALETSDMQSYHNHMSQHHEHMGQWHESKGRHAAADKEYDKAEQHHEKGIQASKAPSRTVKSTNEEVEQIDELSSDTLQKYKTAAHKSISSAAVKRHAGEMSSKEYHKNQAKRSKGINRADADKRLGTYKDKTPKKLDISGSANDIQKKYHSGSGGSRMSEEASLNEDAHKEAETYKAAADAAKKKGDTGSYHAHMANHHDAMAEWHSSRGRESAADTHMKKSEEHHDAFLKHKNMKEEAEQIDELSNDTLASYKKKAGESASEADKKGDFEKGNKRFKGIMKATFKQFANDAKK